jgi:hypothetical protein
MKYVNQIWVSKMKYVYWIWVRIESNTSFPVLQVFWPFVFSKACWWVAVNMLKLYWKKRNSWLQLHFTVRSISFSKVWFQLTFCFRSLGSFGIFWERSLTNQTPLRFRFHTPLYTFTCNPFTCNSKGLLNFCKKNSGRSLTKWTTSHGSLRESIPQFKYFSQWV